LSVSDQPNILFVFTDQQTNRALSAAGNPHLHTPHMGALAQAGTLFRHSYCASPVCAPSRASLQTGRLPHETGVEWNGPGLPAHLPTLGEVLRPAGYETAWTGPWHIPEYFLNGDARGYRHLCPAGRGLGTELDEFIVNQATQFLHEKHARPFFLGVSLLNPHDICYWIMQRHPELLDRFSPTGELPPLPENFAVDPAEPEFIQLCRQRDHYGNELQWTKTWDETDWRRYLAVYYRMVEHADASLGRILAAARQENTLVVFTSDHGEGCAAHRLVVKLMLYEEAATVPLIVSWPGRLPAGRVDETSLVSGIDIMPTLCDYAGVTPPAGLHGRSLRTVADREFVVTELVPDTKRTELKGRLLRTRRFKYVVFSHGQRPEQLFDLEGDPGETRNLVTQPAFQDELHRHRSLLEQWAKQTADTFAASKV